MWQWVDQNAAAVQAIGTLVALAIALAIAWRASRQVAAEARRRREEVLEATSAIVAWAAGMIAEAAQNMADPDNRYRYFLGAYEDRQFAIAETALERIPLHRLAHANLISQFLKLSQALGRARHIISQFNELSATAFPAELPTEMLGALEEQRVTAQKAADEIHAAVFAYRQL